MNGLQFEMSELQFEVCLQNGVISANTESFKTMVAEKMQEYKEKEFTEDTKKAAKTDLAKLRRWKKAVNDRKIEVKKEFMKPYDVFDANVKELISLIDEPISLIDYKVNEFEEKRVRERKAEINSIYSALVSEELEDYIPLECIYGSKWTNATTSIKSIREEIEGIVEKTKNEISVIRSMSSDVTENALNLYMNNRSLAGAVKFINDYEQQKAEILRHQQEKEQRQAEERRQAEIERIRCEERERIREEERIRAETRQSVTEEIKKVDEKAAAPLASKESLRVVYTVVATPAELSEIEMALTSLGVYFERKDV